MSRYVAIWFPHLLTDRLIHSRPELRDMPLAVIAPDHGRMMVMASNKCAEMKGVRVGMVVADCRAIVPELEVTDFTPGMSEKILNGIGEWCIRYSPTVAVDGDGLLLDASGCTHLWGDEQAYLNDIYKRMQSFGYDVRMGMADTIGAAWAVCRYGSPLQIVPPGGQADALLPLPPAALRLETATLDRLLKLGLYSINDFIKMPRSALRRRFGEMMLTRLAQSLGQEVEFMQPIHPEVPYCERLPSMEPIQTATGIEIALIRLLEALCKRLTDEMKGLRRAVLKVFGIDGHVQQVEIGTNRPSRNAAHLFKLFENGIRQIAPGFGIELFILEAPVVEPLAHTQDAMWNSGSHGNPVIIAELLDKIAGKLGAHVIKRYLPAEHYWPERSFKNAASLDEVASASWPGLPRPVHLFSRPEAIEVTVPVPDYPPMLFRHKGQLHKVIKADGPERIEQEWWLQQGVYRDYYCVEDERGARYWLFRSGDYLKGKPAWFIHGIFA